jgi:hypothetical protein
MTVTHRNLWISGWFDDRFFLAEINQRRIMSEVDVSLVMCAAVKDPEEGDAVKNPEEIDWRHWRSQNRTKVFRDSDRELEEQCRPGDDAWV